MMLRSVRRSAGRGRIGGSAPPRRWGPREGDAVYGEKPDRKQEEELVALAAQQADEAEDVTEVDDASVDPDERLEQEEEPARGTGLA